MGTLYDVRYRRRSRNGKHDDDADLDAIHAEARRLHHPRAHRLQEHQRRFLQSMTMWRAIVSDAQRDFLRGLREILEKPARRRRRRW